MKKSTKLLSVLLALVMMFSTVSVALAGSLNVTEKTTVEDVLSNVSLASLLGTLLTDINGAKKNVTGTVLRFVFMFVDNEELTKCIGKTDVTKASDEALAKILLDWLDTYILPDVGDVIPESVTKIIDGLNKVPGVNIALDLSSVNGILSTLDTVCSLSGSSLIDVGILNNLNGNAIKEMNRSKGDLNVVYALIQWLVDNKGALQEAVKGNLNLGIISDFVELSEYETLIKNISVFAKSYLYLLVDGNAKAGKIDKDTAVAAGDWGKSAFKDFTADQLLAAALIRLIRNQDVSSFLTDAGNVKKDANAAINESFYSLLANNLDVLFANYDLATWLNDHFVELVKALSVTDEIKKVFKTSVTFTNTTFNDVYTSAKNNGVLGAVNDLLCVIANTVLTDSAKKTLALTPGTNANLNANLTKICRFVLPLMANDTVKAKLGYDFKAFTASAVKTMQLKEMAVAVLKLFFEDWFNGSSKFSKTDVNNAATLEQLAALAVYYTATNAEWFTEFTVSAKAPAAGLKGDAATKYILDTGALIGLTALKFNGSKIYFDTAVTSGYENIVDEISDWGLNFIKGLPAVVAEEQKAERMPINRGTYDNAMNGGAFYKVNVVLNELIDFAFFTNDKGDKSPTTFKFDLGLFLTDTLLDNLYSFDLEGVFNAFKRNTNAGNVLNQKNVINAVLKIVDRIVTALFKHTNGAEASKSVSTETCTLKTTYSFKYDSANGHYTKAAGVTKTTQNKHNFSKIISNVKGKDCKTYGTRTTQCSICGETKTENTTLGAHSFTVKVKTIAPTCVAQGYDVYKCAVCGKEDAAKHNVKAATGKHSFTVRVKTVAPTCAAQGYDVYKCANCSKEDTAKHNIVAATGKHNYVNGVCSVCKAKEPGPAYKLGDVDSDGKISAADARLALRQSVGLEKYAAGSAQFLACDVDKDGKVSAADARLILRASVGLENAAKW